MRFYKTTYQSKLSKARLGRIRTAHGIIKTPAFVPVATKGTLKSIIPSLVKDIGIQTAFVNTYHLVTHPGAEVIEKAGGIHKYANLEIPLMSDSGGFQVFSLAFKKKQNSTKGILATQHKGEEAPYVIKISDDGVKFRSVFDGQIIEFTPEKSMEYQRQIGADLIMAFDECTYYPASREYTKKALERTHEWLGRCARYKSDWKKGRQFLYGIIQGGCYEDLRKKSAKFVTSSDVDGVAIGGVSVGETKKEMRDQVRWVSDYLPQDKPVHLLGVGQIDDIIDLVKYGIDTFDCVEPTRKARGGALLKLRVKNRKLKVDWEEIDILKGKYRHDLSVVDEDCDCYVCRNFTKSYLHHLFKQKELLGYTLATYHNLRAMERLMAIIRKNIEKNRV